MKELLEKFKITPNDEEIFLKSLTHSSYLNEHQNLKEDLEKLEFMGDAVLQLFVSELIYLDGKAKNEGEMTLMRSKLVRAEALFKLAKEINLGEFLRLGVGADKNGGRTTKNVLADAFEAFIGAIYLDQGYHKVKEVIRELFLQKIKELDFENLIDYKTRLQEVLISDKRKNVKYVEISKKGTPNDPIFEFAVVIDGDIELARGVGKSKKAAQQEAAKKALAKCADL